MRRITLIAAAVLSLAACSGDTTSPNTPDITLLEAGAFGTALTTMGGYDADIYRNRIANVLPEDIAITSEQQAKIKALVEAFIQATKSDREAMGAILREAHQAIEARKSRAEVEAILAKGADIRRRLATAEAKLKADIDAVLTAEQRAWLASHAPTGCRPDKFPPLTDAQKAQIRALDSAFQQKYHADIELVKSVFIEAAAAVKAGKSEQEVGQILAKAAAAFARLNAARVELRQQLYGVLTQEQKASGCLPLG